MRKDQTLYDKIFDMHVVRDLGDNQYQIFIGLHLIHEATSPQAFEMLRESGRKCAYPERTVATADHVTPTDNDRRPYADALGEAMLAALERNSREFGIRFFAPGEANNGVIHVLAPEKGLTQPGTTIACGDSHTSTHGAFGAVALGIGTSQVRDLLASQTLITNRLKVKRIEINGTLAPFTTAKDVILHVINRLGPKAGVGFVFEFAGDAIERMSMEQRMTICNMAVEGGARCGYVNPDDTTFAYLKDTEFAPKGEAWDHAVSWWRSIASDKGAEYAEVIIFRAEDIVPLTTWGITLGQSTPVGGCVPAAGDDIAEEDLQSYREALDYMDLKTGQPMSDMRIDVAFLGSCTNGRFSDFREVADHLKRTGRRVYAGVKALAVPGSYTVYHQLRDSGVAAILEEAGFEVRLPGCSMCLAMNPDKLVGHEVCASSSNRNFKGRQGSPTGRTLIMSPLAVAASAVEGRVADPRVIFAE